MMTTLDEMNFELLPSLVAAEGQVFGIGQDVSIDEDGFDPGETSWATQTTSSTRRGYKQFGRDVMEGPTWSFGMHVNTDDTTQAVEALERMTTAWRGTHTLRNNPGNVIPLRYRLAGRDRIVYGRPGRFAAPPTNQIMSGYVPITAEFETVDAFTYSDQVETVTLDMGPSNQGGFIFPTVFPVNTLPPGVPSQPAFAAVGGTARAYPIIRFDGPWEDPTLTTDRWTLRLNGALGSDDYVEIDTRPWSMSILMNGNVPASRMLRRRTWLEDIYLRPGETTEFELSGFSVLGNARCEIQWRSTWNSI